MTSYHQQSTFPQVQCQCACGTRISLDQQLLNQRQQWKSKYYCLQKQTSKDIALLKEKIYQQCSTLMHSEFLTKQKNHAAIVNAKSIQIQELTSRIIKLETALKISQKQKEVLQRRLEQEEKRYAQKLEELAEVKNNHTKKLNSLQQQNLTQTGTLKLKISEDYEAKLQKLEKENEHLRHKISQFEKKYTAIIPQVQKLKNIINKKSAQVQGLEQQRQKSRQSHAKEVNILKQRVEELQSLHGPCSKQIGELSQTITSLQSQLAKAKVVKREVKVQPVYVDRPVEVQRVVQKLIQVQRIVKEYIQPSEQYRQLCEQNKRMKEQLQNIIRELRQFENRYQKMVEVNQLSTRQYEQNIGKYKTQRQVLVGRIRQQQQQLQKIYMMINSQQRNRGNQQPQRIVVQVGKDGSVNKRVERIGVEERVKATVGRVVGVREAERERESGKQTEVQGKGYGGGNRARVMTSTVQGGNNKRK